MTGRVAERVFPTLTEPLPHPGRAARPGSTTRRPGGRCSSSRSARRSRSAFADDLVRGVVLTDALIGTFADAHDPSLRQNRCFLYHVIGGGTGDWDVPVGGMGALTDALAARRASRRARGSRPATRSTRIATDGTHGRGAPTGPATARHASPPGTSWSNASPQELAALLGEEPPAARRGRPAQGEHAAAAAARGCGTARSDPREAFAGTFHIAEGYGNLAAAYAQAAAGELPAAPPSEIYCHSLTDPSILGPDLAAQGYQTLTLFGLHTPARLFDARQRRRTRGPAASRPSPSSTPTSPSRSPTAWRTDADGRPCIEAKTPLDLERDLRLPGGNIFHRDLAWPVRPGGHRPLGRGDRATPTCCCAARARCAAAGSAGSPATTRRWRCWNPVTTEEVRAAAVPGPPT